jgi:hypothetical protein
MNRRRRWTITAMAVATGLACGGCFIQSDAQVTYGPSGKPLSEGMVGQIKPGETTREWVLAALGEPAQASDIGQTGEILLYEYVRKERASLGVFLLLHSSASNEKCTRLYLELHDGVVKRYWQDAG